MRHIPTTQFISKPPGSGNGQGVAAFAERLVARLAV
jgi:hypothetical protein